MEQSISTSRGRAALEPRREPHWSEPIEVGRYIGYRKIDSARGTWIARSRDSDTGAQKYHALKLKAEAGYSAAVKAAREWFGALDAGIVDSDRPFTVADAAGEYVAELRRKGREKAAGYTEWEFKRTGVTGGAFGRTVLTKLRLPALKAWRDEFGAGLGLGTVNRLVTPVRAAVALAVQNSRVPSTALDPWRALKAYPKADGRRSNFLSIEQRRALLAATEGSPIRDLIAAALVTGARPGELVSLTRGAFDARLRTLRVTGKTGPRSVELSAAAVTLFERLSKSKLPGALLLTNGGKPWRRIDWSRAVRAAVERSGLPANTVLYDCRHSFISQALADGLTTLDVSTLTGTSLAMIQKHYGHVQSDAVRARLDRVTML